MSIRLLFDPALNISAEAFSEAWHQQLEALRLGTATAAPLASETTHTFGADPDVMTAVIGILMGVPSNALWDAIKFTCQKLMSEKTSPQPEIEYQHVKFPDGTEVTIIKTKG